MTPLDQKKVIMDHIKRGDVEYFKTVELDLLLNYRDDDWIDNILGLAIKENQLECCKEILRRCPSQIFYENDYGGTALHHALEAKDDHALEVPNDLRSRIVSMLSFLLDFGSKTGGREKTRFKKWVKLNNDADGHTAMMSCIVYFGYIDVARWWVRVDKDMQLGLLRIPDISKNTPLHYAVKQQDLELVTLLAAREPDFVYGFNKEGDTPLSLAMRAAQSFESNSDKTAEKIRKLLLEKQPNQSKVRIGTDGWTSLHHATNKGDLGAIMEVIQFCPECTELTDNDGRNFLHLAVKLEKIDIVKNVLEIKEISLSVLNGKDNYGYTPLHIAAEIGNEGLILHLLYDPRVDKMTSNAKGQKVLDAITVDYDKTKAEVVLSEAQTQKKVIRSIMTPFDQKKVIMDHIKRGDVEYFKTVELDLLLNYRDDDWIDNILGLAIKENQLECCKEILKRCPSQIFYENEYGGTALHHALEAKDDLHSRIVSMLSFLLDFGSKTQDDIETGATGGGGGKNTRFKKWVKLNNDGDGHTAMMSCIVYFGYIDVARWWVKVDEDMQLGLLRIPDRLKDTALHYAVKQQDLELVTLLAAREPDFVYGPNNEGHTPLSLAMRAAQSSGSNSDKTAEKIRKLLLEKQPNQSKVRIGTEGWTSLHHATNKGDLGAIMEIIQFCPECTELTDNDGRNFLHLAVKLQNIDIVKNVLDIKNDLDKKEISPSVLNGKDNYGYTPLHIAAETGNEDLILCILYDPRVDKMTSNAKGQQVLDAITVDYDKAIAKVYGVRDRVNETELKDQSDFDLVVGALIATVSFTAGITVPGGYIADNGPNSGMAMLAKSKSFKAFVISNSFALVLSLYAVFSHFCTRRLLRREDIIFQHNVATLCTLSAIFAMMVAFITGSYAVLAISNLVAIIVCANCCCFFIFAFHALWKMIKQHKFAKLD